MDRKEETLAVKQALINAGFGENKLRVRHGTGSARGWIRVYVDIHHKPGCSCTGAKAREISGGCWKKWDDCYHKIEKIVADVTNRSDWENNRINVDLGFFE